MTSPIQFPAIQPAQAVAPQPSPLEGLGEIFLHIVQQRQQIETERQRIGLERQRTEAQLASGQITDAEHKQALKNSLREFDLREQKVAGAAIAERYFTPLVAANTLDRASFDKAMVAATHDKEAKGREPYITEAFRAFEKDQIQVHTELAQRRIAEVGANIAEATPAAQITKAKADARTAVARANIEQAMEKLGPGDRASMMRGLESGQPLGIIRKLHGIGPIAGVSDDYTIPQPSGKPSATQEHAGPLLTQWRSSRAVVEGAGAQSLNFVSSMRGKMGIGGIDYTLSKLTNEKQRNLLTGLRGMSEAYRFYVSGQQSSELEAGRLMALLVPTDNKPETLRVKRFLWDTIDQAMSAAAQGQTTPSGAAQQILDAALANKMPQATVKILRQQRDDARKYEASAQFKLLSGQQPVAPRDAFSQIGVLRDPVLREQFGGRRP